MFGTWRINHRNHALDRYLKGDICGLSLKVVNGHVLIKIADSVYLRPLLVVVLSEVGEYGLGLCHHLSTTRCRLELQDIELDLHLVGFTGDE
ncbi:hypothetical protein BBH56_03460 [Spiribacter roseus]|uniref:hypothetical protein n=1 Tax=Spiribacter roseus TaxID=1855875 RepID=UPI000F6DF5CD|nr:hypothetical protein BBH56_03460 [Spiribacter roseus]